MHMPEANRLDQVADVVRNVIRRVRPANVDEAAITRTGEGPDVSIILVPHRALGGLTLGLWADAKGVQLFWANVGDLSYHDDIDLGITVRELPWADDWEKQLVAALETELRRPIDLRSRKRLLHATLVCTVSSDRKEKFRNWLAELDDDSRARFQQFLAIAAETLSGRQSSRARAHGPRGTSVLVDTNTLISCDTASVWRPRAGSGAQIPPALRNFIEGNEASLAPLYWYEGGAQV